MNRGWKWNLVSQMIGHESDGHLSLAVRLLVDGRRDDSFVEVRSHFGEQVGGDEFYFSRESMRAQRTAYRKTVDCVDV